jgi:hypothetical protein
MPKCRNRKHLLSGQVQMQLPSLRRRGEKRPFWCFSRLSDLAAHKDRWLPFKFRATSLSLRQNARHLAHFPPRDARRPTHFGTSEQPQHVFVSFFCCFNPPFESSMTSTTSTIFTPSLYWHFKLAEYKGLKWAKTLLVRKKQLGHRHNWKSCC